MGTDASPGPATGRRESIYIDGFAHANPIPAAARVGNMVYASTRPPAKWHRRSTSR